MVATAFPVRALLPKDTTQASAFLTTHPTWDGRGVVVAILDTGVDPNAPGLRGLTTDGKPKLAHLIDCTGSGDVRCDTTHTLDLAGARALGGPVTLPGLSGRTLTLPPSWTCPSGLFRLGLKNTLDLYPKPLVDRLGREEGTAFQVGQAALLTRVGREVAALEAAPPAPKEQPAQAAKEAKEEARARLEVLKDLNKGFQDPGSWMDVVCWHDGTTWRAAVDVGQQGDLGQTRALASFHEAQEWATFSQASVLNYSVNIYDEGVVVSIVTCAGSHGTHVAAITAAHHPEDPRLNGVAPGAQVISLKIGDTRLGSMETGTGLVRAAIELARLGVDVANISYGEAAAIPDWGKFITALREDVVNASGCIVLSSAGNAGPALSTVGAPGGSSSGIIGVGAYVNHDMMLPEYSMASKVTERPYTWSSRGPTLDGDVGVDIYAPGAAITSVPEYTVQNAQLMNGTSMSSPNASGCVALLVSALKASGLPYNPYSVKTALVNAGLDVADPFGVPFIQVQGAWDQLLATQEGHANHQLHYDVAVAHRHLRRGIYLREVTETRELQRINVNVRPVFPRTLDPGQNKRKLVTEAHILLRATAPWIQVPPFLHLNAGGRDFAVDVDPSKLAAGFHFGEIQAFESGPAAQAGPLFKVPVTVTKPEAVDAVRPQGGEAAFVQYKGLTFGPGDIDRHFISIPANCNFAGGYRPLVSCVSS
jgi:tripeptidyl-peptidase-2